MSEVVVGRLVTGWVTFEEVADTPRPGPEVRVRASAVVGLSAHGTVFFEAAGKTGAGDATTIGLVGGHEVTVHGSVDDVWQAIRLAEGQPDR